MDGIIVSTDGNSFDRIVEVIRTQPQKKQYQIQQILQASADRVLKAAQGTVATDTYALHDSGHVQPSVEDADTIAFDVIFGDGSATPVIYDYGDDQADGYAWFVELGTVHMAPRPYLGPAFEEESQKLVQRLGDMFNEEDTA